MILTGIPKLHTQYLKKIFAQSKAVILPLIGMNKQYLENLSIMLKIASKPREVQGKWVTKSIVTCSKGLLGFYTGKSNPKGFWVETRFC